MRPDSGPVIRTWDTQLCPETETVEKVGGFQLLLLISKLLKFLVMVVSKLLDVRTSKS